MTCTNCNKRLSTGDVYVAQPINDRAVTMDENTLKGRFRFYHVKCIAKVPVLNKLPSFEYYDYNQVRPA